MNRPRARAPKTEPRIIGSLWSPLPPELSAEGSAVPVSTVAPMTEDVPTILDALEETDVSVEDRSEEDALLDREAVDDAESESDSDVLDADAPEELEMPSSRDVAEVRVTDDSVVGDEVDAVAAIEAADAAEAIIEVTWV